LGCARLPEFPEDIPVPIIWIMMGSLINRNSEPHNACRPRSSENSHKCGGNNNGARPSSYTKPCDNIYLNFIVLWTCEVRWIQSHGRLPPSPSPS
jgi:hypothetical protein